MNELLSASILQLILCIKSGIIPGAESDTETVGNDDDFSKANDELNKELKTFIQCIEKGEEYTNDAPKENVSSKNSEDFVENRILKVEEITGKKFDCVVYDSDVDGKNTTVIDNKLLKQKDLFHWKTVKWR